MEVSGMVTVTATRAAAWAVATDVEGWARIIRGVQRIEVVARPASGLTGLRWRETRLLFGDAATVEKWVTRAVEPDLYETRAEQDGFVFTTTLRLAEQGGGVVLTSTHRTEAVTLGARLKALPMVFFRGVIRKAILEELHDLKAAIERG